MVPHCTVFTTWCLLSLSHVFLADPPHSSESAFSSMARPLEWQGITPSSNRLGDCLFIASNAITHDQLILLITHKLFSLLLLLTFVVTKLHQTTAVLAPRLLTLHRFSCRCVSCWWWSLMWCPGSAGRWPTVSMSFSRPMQPTSTAQMTGTHSSLCWSASGLEWDLLPPFKWPPVALSSTQVRDFSYFPPVSYLMIACIWYILSVRDSVRRKQKMDCPVSQAHWWCELKVPLVSAVNRINAVWPLPSYTICSYELRGYELWWMDEGIDTERER